MDKLPLPELIRADGGAPGSAPGPAAAEPDRAMVLEALAQAGDWRRQVVVHRELAVRAAHRAFRRAAWP